MVVWSVKIRIPVTEHGGQKSQSGRISETAKKEAKRNRSIPQDQLCDAKLQEIALWQKSNTPGVKGFLGQLLSEPISGMKTFINKKQ